MWNQFDWIQAKIIWVKSSFLSHVINAFYLQFKKLLLLICQSWWKCKSKCSYIFCIIQIMIFLIWRTTLYSKYLAITLFIDFHD